MSPHERPIICVLGGPGSGKGTQSDLIVSKYNVEHISTGDLIRQKITKSTPSAFVLSDVVKEGKLVSNEEILKLLQTTIQERKKAKGFLIDGYPREKSQGVMFEKTVGKITAFLYFEAREDVLIDRLKARAKTSQRSDDNDETIRKRLITFAETVQDVLELYRDRTIFIDANRDVDEIFKDVESHLDKIFLDGKKKSKKTCPCKLLADKNNK